MKLLHPDPGRHRLPIDPETQLRFRFREPRNHNGPLGNWSWLLHL
jgi:hypothetical protein